MEVELGIQQIKKHFTLSESQEEALRKLGPIYEEWNQKINVISRKDINEFYPRHVLHSLFIALKFPFRTGSKVLDIGTGGGFPGIPLAIMFPDVDFLLIDGTAKKIRIVNEVISKLSLKNVSAQQLRAEECKLKFDFITARAVTGIDRLKLWSQKLISPRMINAQPNGLLTLKGGNPKDETKLLSKGDYTEVYWLKDSFVDEFFETKYLMYLQL